jgi:hypothetical protein
MLIPQRLGIRKAHAGHVFVTCPVSTTLLESYQLRFGVRAAMSSFDDQKTSDEGNYFSPLKAGWLASPVASASA